MLIETVGVGQVEVEIAGEADTTVVVVNPGWGDAVQANKAGLMEIADLFVINKADRPGVSETRRDLDQMLELSAARPGPDPWRPPIMATVASTGEGTAELWAELTRHAAHLEASGEAAARRARRLGAELERVVAARLAERVAGLSSTARYGEVRDQVIDRRLDPWSAADQILAASAER